MRTVDLVATAERVGLRLSLVGEVVRFEAESSPSPNLILSLRARRQQIAWLLANRRHVESVAAWAERNNYPRVELRPWLYVIGGEDAWRAFVASLVECKDSTMLRLAVRAVAAR